MKNIKLIQAEPNRDHWIVMADVDTKKHETQTIMFKGRFDTAIGFIGQNVFQTGAESYTVHITGEHEGRRFNNDWLTVHRNGYIEQDWNKFF